MQKTALIFNPGAGASLLAAQNIAGENIEATLLQMLHDKGLNAEIYYTSVEDPGEGIARELADKRYDLIIAAGGDGTIHSVAHGLLGSASVLGIIPAGTMNNLAYSLGIPAPLEEACDVLTHGEQCTIDIGTINDHIFLEAAGIGLEASLFPAAEAVKSSGILSTFKGIVRGLVTLIRFRPDHMFVIINNDRPRTYRAIQITICNAPYYGIRLKIAPNISMNDGWLDAVIYKNFSKSTYIRHAIAISQGKLPFFPRIIHRRIKSLRVRTNTELEIHADGVVVSHTPAEIKILPQALKVLVPKKPAPGLLTGKTRRI